MAEPVTVIVSVDTEEDNWTPVPYRLTVENIRQLPRLDSVFERLGVRATYFTTYTVAATPWSAEIMRGLVGSGRAEIGAHLHPWNTPPILSDVTPRATMLYSLPPVAQRAKIHALTEELAFATGIRPRSFRAGRWGFDGGTADALIACGYRVDSSVTPFRSWAEQFGPSHVGAPLDVYRIGLNADHRVSTRDGPLVEVPVSGGYVQRSWPIAERVNRLCDNAGLRRLGSLSLAAKLHLFNHVVLSPEICRLDEMQTLAQRLLERGVRLLHLTFHSSSLTPGLNPFVRTPADVEQFYGRLSSIIDAVRAMTPVRFATVGEAAALLAPPLRTAKVPVARATEADARRLVVVSYHFPPDPAIGGLRWAGLTKYLAADGWRSWVVTAAPRGQEEAPDGVTVTALPRRSTLNDVYRRFRARARQNESTDRAGSARAARDGGSWLARARYEGGVLLTLPDEARGWVLRGAWATRRLIRRVRPTAIVSSGPPHSAHVTAWLATRFTRIPWLVDLRDPWAGPITDGWAEALFAKSSVAVWLARRLESMVLRSATTIICNTREFVAALSVRYPRARIEWVPNAVDRALLPSVTADPFVGLSIVHVGTIYGGRNLSPVLIALREFLDRHPAAGTDGTRLRIAGSVEQPYSSALNAQITELALEGQVEILGMLPRAQALALVGRSRLALVLAQNQEFQVPGKLYEMVAMGVQTVVLATLASAAGQEAIRLGAVVVDPDDIASLAAIMEHAASRDLSLPPPVAEEADYGKLAPRVSQLLSRTASVSQPRE